MPNRMRGRGGERKREEREESREKREERREKRERYEGDGGRKIGTRRWGG